MPSMEGGNEQASPPLRPVDPVRLRAHQLLNVIPDGHSIDRVLRYEAHVRRALIQSVHELEARQARRLGEQPPLARVDHNSAPSLQRLPGTDSYSLQQISQDLARAERSLAERKRARRQRRSGGSEDGA